MSRECGHQHEIYSDMTEEWMFLGSVDIEKLTMFLLLLLDLAILSVFTAMIIHIVLTMKYPYSQRYRGEKAYMRTGEYLFTGEYFGDDGEKNSQLSMSTYTLRIKSVLFRGTVRLWVYCSRSWELT
ncbi:hypothetical protein ECG_09598 [Echinococcus granulosus]|nr:hypothetical protein ECG_09598 [Echinococcus granulosus]